MDAVGKEGMWPSLLFPHHFAGAISETFFGEVLANCLTMQPNLVCNFCSLIESFAVFFLCVMVLLTYCGGGSKVESLKEESISMDFYPRMSDLLLSAEPCGMP